MALINRPITSVRPQIHERTTDTLYSLLALGGRPVQRLGITVVMWMRPSRCFRVDWSGWTASYIGYPCRKDWLSGRVGPGISDSDIWYLFSTFLIAHGAFVHGIPTPKQWRSVLSRSKKTWEPIKLIQVTGSNPAVVFPSARHFSLKRKWLKSFQDITGATEETRTVSGNLVCSLLKYELTLYSWDTAPRDYQTRLNDRSS